MYDDCNLKIDIGDWKGFTTNLRRRFVGFRLRFNDIDGRR